MAGIIERMSRAKPSTEFPRVDDHPAVIEVREAVQKAREPWIATNRCDTRTGPKPARVRRDDW